MQNELTKHQYRCTRQAPYSPGCPGFTDTSARQGYYLLATDEADALAKMNERYADETEFTAELWKD